MRVCSFLFSFHPQTLAVIPQRFSSSFSFFFFSLYTMQYWILYCPSVKLVSQTIKTTVHVTLCALLSSILHLIGFFCRSLRTHLNCTGWMDYCYSTLPSELRLVGHCQASMDDVSWNSVEYVCNTFHVPIWVTFKASSAELMLNN